MTKRDYTRTRDGNNRIVDSNLKAAEALYVPVFDGEPTLNDNPDEAGAIGMRDGKVTAYDGTGWNDIAYDADKQDVLGFTPEDTANKNTANGYAGLDGSGKVAAAQLPSYVDDVLEYANYAALPGTGETGKIYVTLDDNKEYRWSGSTYIQIVASPGSTDDVAEGSTNLYFTAARVLAAVLTGIGFGTATAITATDTILAAFGKLQAQITQLFSRSLPSGGATGKILAKASATDYDAAWIDAPTGGGGSVRVYNVEDYGAVHDGATDDTIAVQSAINACHTAGGGVVYFPNGIYLIDGALTDGNQISVPYDQFSLSQNLTHIKLMGETSPVKFTDPLYGGLPPNTGAILLSSLSGAGNIIGSASTGSPVLNYCHFEVSCLTIRSKSKSGPTNIAPEATAINGSKLAYLTMYDVAIDTESARNATVLPLSTSVGVWLPPTDNYAWVTLDKVLVTGYYTAFEVYECASLTNVFVDGCYYGLSFNGSNHPAFVSKIFISRTAIDIVVRGVISFFIDHYGFETTASGAWYDSIWNLQELVTGSQGLIRYNKVISNVGKDNSMFTRTGMSTVNVESIGYSAQTDSIKAESGNYTLTPIDREKTIIFDSADDMTVNIPDAAANYFPVGTKISLIQKGVGRLIILPNGGVTVNAYQGFNISGGQFAKVGLLQTDVNVWVITGDLIASSDTTVADFIAAAGITDSGQQSALTALVSDLKSAGLWSKIAVLYPFAGSTAVQHSYNLKSVSLYQLFFSGSGTHDANGYHPNGTDAYADTQCFLPAAVGQNSAHMAFYSLDNLSDNDSFWMGSFDSSTGLILHAKGSDGNNYSLVNGPSSHLPPSNSSGLFLVNRVNSTSDTYSRNGTLVSTSSDTSRPLATVATVLVGAINKNGSPANFTATGCGFACMGAGLLSGEITSFNTIIQTYLTAMGR